MSFKSFLRESRIVYMPVNQEQLRILRKEVDIEPILLELKNKLTKEEGDLVIYDQAIYVSSLATSDKEDVLLYCYSIVEIKNPDTSAEFVICNYEYNVTDKKLISFNINQESDVNWKKLQNEIMETSFKI